MNICEPQTALQAQEMIADHLTQKRMLTLSGGETRVKAWRGTRFSLLGLNRTRFFEPADMVVGVEAGMRFEHLRALLADGDMVLPAEPWFKGVTVGGMFAANEFGPGRLERGGLRDAVIGIEYIDGHGQLVKGGGKVVKNVTGYDLGRLMCGSLGGLGCITAVHFKVMPRLRSPQVLYGQWSQTAWLAPLLALHREAMPLDWVQVVKHEDHWLLGLGISGNQPRRSRLCREVQKHFGGRLAIGEDDSLPPEFEMFAAANRQTGFLSPLITGLPRGYVHLHGVFPTARFLGGGLQTLVQAKPSATVIHPIGGDVHLFFSGDAVEKQAVAQLLRNTQSWAGYWHLVRVPHAWLGEFGRVCPRPAEFPLMQALKHKMDPQPVFHSDFYAMEPL